MLDLFGGATAVSVSRSSGAGGDFGFPNVGATGDFALLMEDGQDLSLSTGFVSYTFTGLQNGQYQVYTYAWAPDAPAADQTLVQVTGAVEGQQTVVGNPPANTFVLGQTHALHNITTTNGTIVVRADGAPGSFGTINGIQLVLTPPPPPPPGFIFIDTFESYFSFSDLYSPGAWADFLPPPSPVQGVEVRLSGGNTGHYVYHPAGPTIRHELIPISTSAGQWIVWESDFFLEEKFPSWNKRITNGLRVEGTTTILEMGIHNNNLNPETGLPASGYAIRTVSIGGEPSNWVCFPGNPDVSFGWHHFRATIKPTEILFELDLGADGVYDTARLVTTIDTSSIAWNSLRIGGPSDLSSPSGGAGFDNVSIRLVPACPADMVSSDTFAPPGDGSVDAADLAFLLGEWGRTPEGGSPADFVTSATFQPPPDGNVDAADLAVLLGDWGACD